MAEHALSGERLLKAERIVDAARTAADALDYETVASRSYYAVLHAIKALSPYADRASTHEHLADWLEPSDRWPRLRDSRRIRAAIERLQRWRRQADYDLEPVTAGQAADALRFAVEFLRVAKEMLTNDHQT